VIGADGLIDCAAMLAADRAILDDAERLAAEHSPAAIFRRSRRASYANQPKARAWKARALGLNPTPAHNSIALSGMVPLQIDDRWHLAVALPQPAPGGGDTAGIEDLVLIDPAANRAHVMGDVGRDHVGPAYGVDRLPVMTDPKAWARDIALARMEWFQLAAARQRANQAAPFWLGGITAALLLAPTAKVRWSDLQAKVLDVPADMRRDVQRAIFAQARLPRIEGRA
jgi:hypothetical protein